MKYNTIILSLIFLLSNQLKAENSISASIKNYFQNKINDDEIIPLSTETITVQKLISNKGESITIFVHEPKECLYQCFIALQVPLRVCLHVLKNRTIPINLN
jgi:hypothetical protein